MTYAMKVLATLILFFSASYSFGQMTAEQIIEKSIKVHDSKSNWHKLKANIEINSIVERNGKRDTSKRNLNLNLANSEFIMHYFSGEDEIKYVFRNDECQAKILNLPEATEEILNKKNVSCERAKMYNSYFRYLLGMPMKLKDPGTIIDEKVIQKSYKGKEYHVVTVTYEPEVGSYTWLFYFDKENYELDLMEFSKDGSFLNGETIELNNKVKYQNMILPGQLVWYVLPDRPFLAEENISYFSSGRE